MLLCCWPWCFNIGKCKDNFESCTLLHYMNWCSADHWSPMVYCLMAWNSDAPKVLASGCSYPACHMYTSLLYTHYSEVHASTSTSKVSQTVTNSPLAPCSEQVSAFRCIHRYTTDVTTTATADVCRLSKITATLPCEFYNIHIAQNVCKCSCPRRTKLLGAHQSFTSQAFCSMQSM